MNDLVSNRLPGYSAPHYSLPDRGCCVHLFRSFLVVIRYPAPTSNNVISFTSWSPTAGNLQTCSIWRSRGGCETKFCSDPRVFERQVFCIECENFCCGNDLGRSAERLDEIARMTCVPHRGSHATAARIEIFTYPCNVRSTYGVTLRRGVAANA